MGLRVFAGRERLAQTQEGFRLIVDEFDLDVVEAAGGAMLDGQEGLPVAPAQVEIAVSPGMQLAAPPQGLAGPRGPALAGMVDNDDGGVEAALDVAQMAEDGGDVGGGVLVDAVQADQGIEDEQTRRDALDGVAQCAPVARLVETQGGDVDDGDVKGLEGGAGGAGDSLETPAHEVAGVLGAEQQHRAGAGGCEVTQAGDAGGDGDGEVEGQHGLAALGLAADDADGLVAPQGVDEPLLLARALLEFGRGAGREALHGESSSRAASRCSAVTVLASSRAAAESA